MPVTLTLTRKVETPVMEIHRGPFDVVVDRNRVGRVGNGETFEATIDAGGHTLRVHTGRWSSRTSTFDAAEGDAIAFRCHGRRLWPILLASLVVPSVALKLIRE